MLRAFPVLKNSALLRILFGRNFIGRSGMPNGLEALSLMADILKL